MIEIMLKRGKIKINTFGIYGDFAVHKMVEDLNRWTITHLPTGKALFRSEKEKLPFVRKLAKACDLINESYPVFQNKNDKRNNIVNEKFKDISKRCFFYSSGSGNPIKEAELLIMNEKKQMELQ